MYKAEIAWNCKPMERRDNRDRYEERRPTRCNN
jgi:hypothetical protein